MSFVCGYDYGCSCEECNINEEYEGNCPYRIESDGSEDYEYGSDDYED